MLRNDFFLICNECVIVLIYNSQLNKHTGIMEWSYTLLHFFLLNLNVWIFNITLCLISAFIQIHLLIIPQDLKTYWDQDAILEKNIISASKYYIYIGKVYRQKVPIHTVLMRLLSSTTLHQGQFSPHTQSAHRLCHAVYLRW